MHWLDELTENDFEMPQQKKCAVAFVDVLGTSEKIKADSKWTLFWMWFLYNGTIDLWGINERIKIKIFSDNILICEEIDEARPKTAVMDVLYVLDTILMRLFTPDAMFLRGAMVVDDLYFSENFVYGKALLKAYSMESKSVIYPRIVLDDSVFDIIKPQVKNITLDKDGLYFYDFIQSRIASGSKRLSQNLKCLRANIILNMKKNATNPHVIAKYEWLVNYFNETCSKNNLAHRITEKDIKECGLELSPIHIVAKTER